MEPSRTESLDDAAAALDRLIVLAQERGLHDSAQFLAMAKMQVLIDINGITDVEFLAFCDWLDGKRPQPDGRRSARLRVRRNGRLHSMGRAWLCPEDEPRRSRGRVGGAGRA